jgi:hypothetical protein
LLFGDRNSQIATLVERKDALRDACEDRRKDTQTVIDALSEARALLA